MKEFDNMKTESLSILLNENTILKRFYPLIPMCDRLTKQLLELGIKDKYMFFERMDLDPEKLSSKLNVEIDVLKLLEGLFHLHDYKNRKLSEVKSAKLELIQALISDGVKTSKDYLSLCISNNVSDISKKYSMNVEDVIHLFDLCDLMRLPGVKDVRAALYYDCGYKRLQDFIEQSPENMRQQIGQLITENKIDKSVPLMKELATQIAVAKVLPHISMIR